MIIQIDDYTVDVDLDATKAYSQTHCLCDCQDDRNFYAQARERFPKLTQFLSRFGLMIERPDEIGSYAEEGEINYHFVAYTVVGKVLKSGRYEIDMFDGNTPLNIVINDWGVPNEQNTTEYFTVTVYNIHLPWVLDEQYPEEGIQKTQSLISRFWNWLCRRKTKAD